MKVKILNNSCFLIESEKTKILVDPYISKDLIKTIKYDYVLISHVHIDHALHLKSFDKPIIATKKLLIKSNDINLDDYVNGSIIVNDIEIFLTQTNHPHILQKLCLDSLIHSFFIRQKFFISYKSYGFVFQNNQETIYYSGDTTFNESLFQDISKKYNPDYCLINMEDVNKLNFYLLSPMSKKELLEDIFNSPIYPIHKPLNWYIRNDDLYKSNNVCIFDFKKKKGDI